MTKLKFKTNIFKSSYKSLFYFFYNFFIMPKNLSAECYQEYKVRRQKTHERYQNLSKEEKVKKRQYDRERYKNLSENEKQKLVEYKKIIIE